MTECKHSGYRASTEPYSFICEHCGVDMCSDCGTTPAHEDSTPGYCRRCSEKGGHRYDFFTEIDHDKLRAKVGRDLAAQIIGECRVD